MLHLSLTLLVLLQGGYRDLPPNPRPEPPTCDWGNGGGCRDKDENKDPDLTGRGGVPPSVGGGGSRVKP